MRELSIKEIVSALLSIAIVGITLYIMIDIVSGSTDPRPYQLSVFQAALGLAGTATGYYFGRIPAEQSAKAAQDTAKDAQTMAAAASANAAKSAADAQQAQAAKNHIVNQLTTLNEQLGAPVGAGANPAEDNIREDIHRRLNIILGSST